MTHMTTLTIEQARKPAPRKPADVVIHSNGWISPRSLAGHKACKPRGGIQCVSVEAAEGWARGRKLNYRIEVTK